MPCVLRKARTRDYVHAFKRPVRFPVLLSMPAIALSGIKRAQVRIRSTVSGLDDPTCLASPVFPHHEAGVIAALPVQQQLDLLTLAAGDHATFDGVTPTRTGSILFAPKVVLDSICWCCYNSDQFAAHQVRSTRRRSA
jgi:hypothetical protein